MAKKITESFTYEGIVGTVTMYVDIDCRIMSAYMAWNTLYCHTISLTGKLENIAREIIVKNMKMLPA